jgi:predicted DNA-binding antitoxin AbrB/MazE fold protein
MSLDVEAIYENGALKIARELPLQEGQKVKITIHSTVGAAQRLYGMVKWSGSSRSERQRSERDSRARDIQNGDAIRFQECNKSEASRVLLSDPGCSSTPMRIPPCSDRGTGVDQYPAFRRVGFTCSQT